MLGGLTAAAAAVALLSTTSSAANAAWVDVTPVVSFTMSDTLGFEFPTSWRAGNVTLKGSTTDTTYHALQGFKPLRGHTPDEVVENLRKGVAGATLEESAEGHRWLLQNALLVGGVVTTLRGPVSVTIPLERGTYTFFDVNDIFLGITPRLHTVRVVGRWRSSPLPAFETEFSASMQMSSNNTTSHGDHHPLKRITATMDGADPGLLLSAAAAGAPHHIPGRRHQERAARNRGTPDAAGYHQRVPEDLLRRGP